VEDKGKDERQQQRAGNAIGDKATLWSGAERVRRGKNKKMSAFQFERAAFCVSLENVAGSLVAEHEGNRC